MGNPRDNGYGDGPPPHLAEHIDKTSQDYIGEGWGADIQCKCGAKDQFAAFHGNSTSQGWVKTLLESDRTDLTCQICEEEISLFDDGIHGYNAVICDGRDNLPEGYRAKNKKVLEKVQCQCGHTLFSVNASVMYDCDPEEEEEEESGYDIEPALWQEAYGSYSAEATCTKCGTKKDLSASETA